MFLCCHFPGYNPVVCTLQNPSDSVAIKNNNRIYRWLGCAIHCKHHLNVLKYHVHSFLQISIAITGTITERAGSSQLSLHYSWIQLSPRAILVLYAFDESLGKTHATPRHSSIMPESSKVGGPFLLNLLLVLGCIQSVTGQALLYFKDYLWHRDPPSCKRRVLFLVLEEAFNTKTSGPLSFNSSRIKQMW